MQTVKVFHEQIDKIQVLQEMSNYLRMCGAVTPRFFEGVLKKRKYGIYGSRRWYYPDTWIP